MKHVARGFALVETMVSLLLLAIGIHGAASTMIRGQAELRATLLATQAAGLAADLAEQLRASGGDVPDAVLAQWQQAVAAALSTSTASGRAQGRLELLRTLAGLPASHSIRIEWWDPGVRAPRRLDLPVLLASAPVEH
jgi:Tfp pilus assembly protein PilV